MAVQGRLEVAGTDHVGLIYKVDYLVQSSPLSSLVLTNIRFYLLTYSHVKIIDSELYFIFSFHFSLFYFSFSFLIFYFQNNLGQGLSVMLSHQSQIDGVVTRLITGLGRMKQKVLEQSDIIQHGQHMLASCYTHGCLGQGAQQLAWTMGNSI